MRWSSPKARRSTGTILPTNSGTTSDPGHSRGEPIGVKVRVVEDGRQETRTCSLTESCAVGSGGGPRASYDPKAPTGSEFEVSVPVETRDRPSTTAAPGRPAHGFGQDADGNTQVTAEGSAGSFTDGRTGVTVPFALDAGTTLRLIDRPRMPFEGTIYGQVIDYRGPTVKLPEAIAATALGPHSDQLTTSGRSVTLSGNGADQALITFEGPGTFISAEGDLVQSDGLAGTAGTAPRSRPRAGASSATTRSTVRARSSWPTGTPRSTRRPTPRRR